MADKYVNQTDLAYYHNRIKTLFPAIADFNDLSDTVDGLVTEGGDDLRGE